MASRLNEPWRHPLRWSEIGRAPQRISLLADEATRAAVARALSLPAIARLSAELTVSPWLDGAEVSGHIDAVVTQICGVSLDPFDTEVIEDVHVRVVPAGSPHAAIEETEDTQLDPDSEDPPDVIPGETIDLAAYVVEHLALALDPFPRKPGVEFEQPQEPEPESPFAVLKALKTPSPKG